MKKLKIFQRNAVDKLIFQFDRKLDLGNERIIFKAPTGSGKTFMMTKVLEEISLKYSHLKMCFLWISIGKGELHKQSYNSVRNSLKGLPNSLLLDQTYLISNEIINDKDCLFVNWEKLTNTDRGTGNWSNIMMKEGDYTNLPEILEKTRNDGIKIILIIDESHIGRSEDKQIRRLQSEVINADLTIEMSATINNPNVEVKLKEVVEEGLVKENLIINQNIGEIILERDADSANFDSFSLIMDLAYEKYIELKNEYMNIGSKVNPLCLIQIPNTKLGDEYLSKIEEYLRDKEITRENGLLGIWIDKLINIDTEKIKNINDPVSFLVFKTVVNTGWDCPRSQILVKFRDVKSETALIQTLGRIMRTAEAKSYDNPKLDAAYIFTNMPYIDLRDADYLNANAVKDIKVKLKEGLNTDIQNIPSFYKSRAGNFNTITEKIYPIIKETFINTIGKEVVSLIELEKNGWKVQEEQYSKIISEVRRSHEDIISGIQISGMDFNVKPSSTEIDAMIDSFLDSFLEGLNKSRSKSPIIVSFRKLFEEVIFKEQDLLGKPIFHSRAEANVLSKNLILRNLDQCGKVVNDSIEKFKIEYPETSIDGDYEEYIFEEEKFYSSQTYKELMSELSLYMKMYVQTGGTSNVEQRFLNFVDMNRDKIDWIFHNGQEPNKSNFGIKIEIDRHAFRPDFIIRYKDGKIGIFDTKGIDSDANAPAKANALARYINIECEGKNIVGGIVIEYNGLFYVNYNEGINYKTFNEDRNQWSVLEF